MPIASTPSPIRRTSAQEAHRVRLRILEEGPRILHVLVGDRSGELLTVAGRLLVHDNPVELGLLYSGATVEAIPPSAARDLDPDRLIPVAALEDSAALLWPLAASDFRSYGDGYEHPTPTRTTVPTQEATHG